MCLDIAQIIHESRALAIAELPSGEVRAILILEKEEDYRLGCNNIIAELTRIGGTLEIANNFAINILTLITANRSQNFPEGEGEGAGERLSSIFLDYLRAQVRDRMQSYFVERRGKLQGYIDQRTRLLDGEYGNMEIEAYLQAGIPVAKVIFDGKELGARNLAIGYKPMNRLMAQFYKRMENSTRPDDLTTPPRAHAVRASGGPGLDSDDLTIREGGDEGAKLFPGVETPEQLLLPMLRVYKALDEPFELTITPAEYSYMINVYNSLQRKRDEGKKLEPKEPRALELLPDMLRAIAIDSGAYGENVPIEIAKSGKINLDISLRMAAILLKPEHHLDDDGNFDPTAVDSVLQDIENVAKAVQNNGYTPEGSNEPTEEVNPLLLLFAYSPH